MLRLVLILRARIVDFRRGLLSLTLVVSCLAFDLPDTEGRRHTQAEIARSKAAVFFFLSADCPLSNRYAPELARLFTDYSPRGIVFYAVYPDRPADARYPFSLLLDPGRTLARETGVMVTPEVAVLSPAGQRLYRGRIDDRVVDFGKQRQAPVRQDLRAALDEILAGRPVASPVTKAVGCALLPVPATGAAKVTFSRDVAPILYKHCAGCHHPGGDAPFPLLSYQDAARRASVIAGVTASRYMPPWKPQPGYGRFYGERRLSDAKIATLRGWAESGASEGDPARLPPAPQSTQGWRLGPPDLIVKLAEPFAVEADGPDDYRCFVMPLGLDQDKYLRAVEFHPGNRKVVHHALFFADPSGVARQKGGNYRCFGSPGFLPASGLGGWSPGSNPAQFPDGAPAVVRKGSDLVLQVHFHPTGKAEQEQSSLGLYFTGAPPVRKLVDIPLGSRDIDIPAGERSYKVRDHFTLPIDVEAIGIIPHAHYVCKDMKGWAVLPDGTKKWLIWIPDWDFNWQEQYRYTTPLRLPADTRLEMEFTYDNSNDNFRNPNHPSKRVVWGPEITDEMAGLHLQVLPARMPDLPILTQALWGKMMRSVGGGFRGP